MKKYFRLEVKIFFSSFILFMLAGRSKLFSDPGTFTHTIIGENIIQSGNFIKNDIFSFTFYGKPWVAHQWLGECIMALLNRIGGLDALLFMGVLLLSSVYTWLAFRLNRSGLSPLFIGLVITLVFVSSSSHLHIRPHLFSILFLGIIYSILCDYEKGHVTFLKLLWLIPIFIVWTNIHGGVLAGIGTLWITVIGWSISRTIGLQSSIKSHSELVRLWMLLILISLTPFLNPYGSETPKAWYAIMKSPVIEDVILEHLSVFELFRYHKFNSFIALVGILSLSLLYFISLAGYFPKKPRISLFIPAIWFILTLSRIRHAPLFAIVSAIALSEIIPDVRWFDWAKRKGLVSPRLRSMNPIGKPHLFAIFVVVFLIFSIIAGVHLKQLKAPLPDPIWAKLDAERWPIELLPELKAYEKWRPEGTPIFNDFEYGGYLMYFTPELRVFIDDRCELYGDKFLFDYVHPDFDRFFDYINRSDLEVALVRSSSKYANFFERMPDWKEVDHTGTAVLFKKSYSNFKDPV